MPLSLRLQSSIVSALVFVVLIGAWHLASRPTSSVATMSPEYAKLMGATATQGQPQMPGPLDVGAKLWDQIRNPFYGNGPNNRRIGIQRAYSIARLGNRLFSGSTDGCPIGFLIGISPLREHVAREGSDVGVHV
jgi:nitrate/nitrite transport system permease protein